MKKFITYFSAIVAVLFMMPALVSCGGDDDKEKDEPDVPKTLNEQLVGTWIEKDVDADESPYILTFRSNQTGTLEYTISSNSSSSRATITVSQSFKWNAGTNTSGFSYIEVLTTGGDNIIEDNTYTLSLIGDDLSFGGLRFIRR